MDSKKAKKVCENKEDEYYFHFSVSGFGVLLLDVIFNNKDTYGEIDYVTLLDNGMTYGYLSAQGMQEAYDIGAGLLDDIFFENLREQSEELDGELKNYKPKTLDNKSAYTEWKRKLSLLSKFCRWYRFYEQPFQQSLEKYVLGFLSEDDLLAVLSDKSFEKVHDTQVRKYIERLVFMGEMKLRLHEDSEKLFTDDTIEKYVSENSGLSLHLIKSMTVAEFEKVAQGEILVGEDELEKRLGGCVFAKENDKWTLYIGKEYIDWKNKIMGKQSSDIKGRISFPGRVIGRVVVHLSWTSVTEIKEGDVLVAGMTNPQMIPMIKKAIAIVTDEGGITCHAAIIAREMKKPCITGTKIATQVLKDGDLVEVDANKGIVRIIKKNGV